MKRGGKAVVWLVAGLVLGAGTTARTETSASSSDGPYRAIVDRNVFDLRPVPVAPPPVAPATPPPNVKLVGLMILSGQPQGVFSVQDPTPGKQPVTYILSVDQRQASLEVKSINMTGKSARVQIGEDISELKLVDSQPAAAATPAPGLPGGPRPFGPGGRQGGRGGFPMPGQPPGVSPQGGYNPTPSASYSPGVSPDAGANALPTRPVRTDSGDDSMTAEQQMVNIEQNRAMYQQQGSPLANLLPPTPLTAALQAQQNTTGDQNGNTTPTPETPTGNRPPLGARRTGTFPMPPMP
jgi:hypothetical protein